MKEKLLDTDPNNTQEQATKWFVRLRADDVSSDEYAEYQAWLDADPQNALHYKRVEDKWLNTEVLRDYALARLDKLEEETTPQKESGKQHSWWKTALFGGGLTASAIALLIAVLLPGMLPDGYQTDYAEQRRIPLPDSSAVVLNVNSAIEVDYKADIREVNLKKGEAFFDVASEKQRPFVVVTKKFHVKAVGTQFSILTAEGSETTTVVEGSIEVNILTNPQQSSILLTAGQKISFDNSGNWQLHNNVSFDKITAWQQGKILFNKEPVYQVVAELNRYFKETYLISPELENATVSGIFPINSSKGIIVSLEKILNADAVRNQKGQILFTPRSEI